MICAHLKSLSDQIELVATDSSDANGPHTEVNPLGKIPALTLDDGRVLFDSRVICEYLDTLAPTPKLFLDGKARWSTLTLGALADGICDAMILTVYEKRLRPPEAFHQPWVDRQLGKVNRAVAHLEANEQALDGALDYGQIAVACALGYLDLRSDGHWRKTSPKLVAWLDNFASSVPAFDTTRPPAA